MASSSVFCLAALLIMGAMMTSATFVSGGPRTNNVEYQYPLYRSWTSVYPDDLLEALKRDGLLLDQMPSDNFKFGKRGTWWYPLTSKSTHAPRFAAEAAVHILKWYQVREKTDNIGFHYDKDEATASEEMRLVLPAISTVSYLTNIGAPTLIFNQTSIDGNDDEPRVPVRGALVYPERNKHIFFQGNLMHGVAGTLGAEHAANVAAQLQDQSTTRVTFLVNWWAYRPAPPNCIEPPASVVNKLVESSGGLKTSQPRSDTQESDFTALEWVAGDHQNVQIELPGAEFMLVRLPKSIPSPGSFEINWTMPGRQILGGITLDLSNEASKSQLFRAQQPKVLIFYDPTAPRQQPVPELLLEGIRPFDDSILPVVADYRKTGDAMKFFGVQRKDLPVLVIHDTAQQLKFVARSLQYACLKQQQCGRIPAATIDKMNTPMSTKPSRREQLLLASGATVAMEEVDRIILLNLKHLGTEIPETVQTVSDLGTDVFVEGCARCLNVINQSDEMPLKLPSTMAARFQVGTTLAKACQALGYTSSIGYNTFLYGNENDCRNILMWLIERLPQDVSDATQASAGTTGLARFRAAVAADVRRRIELPFLPHAIYRDGAIALDAKTTLQMNPRAQRPFRTNTLEIADSNGSQERVAYETEHMPLVTAQPMRSANRLTSLLAKHAALQARRAVWQEEWSTLGMTSGKTEQQYRHDKQDSILKNMRQQLQKGIAADMTAHRQRQDIRTFLDGFANVQLGKKSLFRKREELQFQSEASDAPKAATQEELEQQRQAELEELETRLSDLMATMQSLQGELSTFDKDAVKMDSKLAELKALAEELAANNAVRKRVLDLLPNADENIERLGQAIDALARKLIAIGEKWEPHRRELLREYQQLKSAAADQMSEIKVQMAYVQEMRETTQGILAGAKAKEQRVAELQAEYEKRNNATQRSWYVERILEIIKSINKQSADIETSILDIRAMQREINQISDRLSRQFTVVDEMVFKDAKKDADIKRAYQLLASLHTGCEDLIQCVENIGSLEKECRELDNAVHVEQAKNLEANLLRIEQDSNVLKNETADLAKQLKA
ncbi:uncharacterized protein MONBRDRAFT_31538 [Monosiga brevicollis MX1]|uniref:Coiled-coil domain-containing protein 22 homolog n=1 Tax=Monosiga brevicollis TaxID=81824 RepID=A9UTU2_MONBE|nr:uncharacterized protein MONBRDRAFT_31538 [Monosiga brevicollis MX1]EDQ91553.1 predicted protein [Monosiga brevicollis MX1]|eukprot:XP_001743975.1 hypothetical protein [Monosiga brevicollis MX1]